MQSDWAANCREGEQGKIQVDLAATSEMFSHTDMFIFSSHALVSGAKTCGVVLVFIWPRKSGSYGKASLQRGCPIISIGCCWKQPMFLSGNQLSQSQMGEYFCTSPACIVCICFCKNLSTVVVEFSYEETNGTPCLLWCHPIMVIYFQT